MSNERRRRELEVLSAADALVGLWERSARTESQLGPEASALLAAMRSLRSFEEDEAEADAAYEQALREPLPEGSVWGLTQQAPGLPVEHQTVDRLLEIERRLARLEDAPLPVADGAHMVPLRPGFMLAVGMDRSVHTAQLPPHDERGVVAVAESALGKLCLALATARWARHKSGRPTWRGDGEEVRLVWDEFLSGHDARLLP